MLRRWRSCSQAAAFMVAVLIGVGCAGSGPAEYPPQDYVPAEVQLGSESQVVSESRIDSQNRYLFTAAVSTKFLVPAQGIRELNCSGVLIHPRAVLTAGHCVCRPRRSAPPEAADASFIDRSTCVETTSVTMIRYQADGEALQGMLRKGLPSLPGEKLGPFRGKVHVHEDIRILYREAETSAGWESSTEYSHADLAIIVLDQPLRGQVEPVKLAEKPIQLKERVILVGFGAPYLGETAAVPVRRYGDNEVVSIKEDGSTFHIGKPIEVSPGYSGEKPELVRRRGSYAAGGDSGGPCLRERSGNMELVGIARSTHGPPMVLSVYTSTYGYLGWLHGKLKAVESGEID